MAHYIDNIVIETGLILSSTGSANLGNANMTNSTLVSPRISGTANLSGSTVQFGTHQNIIMGTSTGSSPSDGQLRWDSTLHSLFAYDSLRAKWLSVSRWPLQFASGSSDGAYVPVGVAGPAANVGIRIPYNGTITKIVVHASGATGQSDKGIEIRANDAATTLVSFSLSSFNYTDVTTNTDVSAGDYLKVFAVTAGVGLNDVVIIIEVAWRI